MSTARRVSLAPCTDLEYAEFVSLQVAEYAHQLVRLAKVTAKNGVGTARELLDDWPTAPVTRTVAPPSSIEIGNAVSRF